MKNLRILAAMLILFGAPAIADIDVETRQNHILFDQGGSQLAAPAKDQLGRLSQVLVTSPMDRACLRLVGYSDATGGDAINLSISKARADAVASYLSEQMGSSARILEVEGRGAIEFLTGISPTSPFQRRVAIFARDCPLDM